MNQSPPSVNDAAAGLAATLAYPNAISSQLQRPQEGVCFVIFGASGDLTKRKLIPALYNLACNDLLPKDFSVIGYSVTPMSDDSFREGMRTSVQESKEANSFDPKIWDDFARGLYY